MQPLKGFVWFCIKLFSLPLDPASHRHLAQVHLRQAHPGQAGEVLHEEWRRPRAHRGPHKRPHVDACWLTLKPIEASERALLTYDPLPWFILMLLLELEKIYDYAWPKNTVMLTQPPFPTRTHSDFLATAHPCGHKWTHSQADNWGQSTTSLLMKLLYLTGFHIIL